MITIVNICIEINLEDSLPNLQGKGRRWEVDIRRNFHVLSYVTEYLSFFNKKSNYHNNIRRKNEGVLEKT